MPRNFINNFNKLRAIIVLIATVAFVTLTSIVFASRESNKTRINDNSMPRLDATETPSQPDETGQWVVFEKQGVFSVSHPKDYQVFINEVVSVDGVTSESENTLTLIPDDRSVPDSNFVMTLKYEFDDQVSLQQAIENNNWCTYLMATENGTSYTLGDKIAILFENTPCGSFGSTVIYAVDEGIIYQIIIESSSGFDSVREKVESILTTFSKN